MQLLMCNKILPGFQISSDKPPHHTKKTTKQRSKSSGNNGTHNGGGGPTNGSPNVNDDEDTNTNYDDTCFTHSMAANTLSTMLTSSTFYASHVMSSYSVNAPSDMRQIKTGNAPDRIDEDSASQQIDSDDNNKHVTILNKPRDTAAIEASCSSDFPTGRLQEQVDKYKKQQAQQSRYGMLLSPGSLLKEGSPTVPNAQPGCSKEPYKTVKTLSVPKR